MDNAGQAHAHGAHDMSAADQGPSREGITSLGRHAPWLTALGLIVLVGLTYGRSVGFGFVDWDDDAHILRNPMVAHPLAFGWRTLLLTPFGGYPQPLALLTQHVDHWVGGGQAWSFHLSNLLLHTGNAVLLALLLRSLGLRALAAFFAAALWAVHPLGAEAVCWATGRKDLLATTLLLVALWSFRTWQQRSPRPCWPIWLMVLATLLGLLCKPTLVVVPALIALALALQGPRPTRGMVIGLALLTLLSAVVIAIAWIGQSRVHVVDLAATRSLGQRTIFASQHLAMQLRNWAVPLSLSARYFEPLPQPVLSAWGMAGLLAFLLALAGAIVARRRGAPLVALAVAFVLITFLPSSGLAPLNRGVADIYFYVPSMALAGLLAALAQRLAGRFRTVMPALGGLVVAAALLGHVQAGTWVGPSALWQRVWEKYPEHRWTWWAYADSLVMEGKLRRGLDVYIQGLQHFPYPPDQPTGLISVGTGCLLVGDLGCASNWLGELVRHFGTSLPNSLRLLAADASDPADHAEEKRRARATAESALRGLANAPADERASRVRSLLGTPPTLDMPAQRGLDILARDPQLAEPVKLLRQWAVGPAHIPR